MSKKIGLVFLTVVAALDFSGCATIFGDTKDLVNIHSAMPDAKIIVNGNEIGKGSAQYAVTRGKEITMTASKPGCSDRSVQSERRVVGATWFDILFWPGFLVDIATGAMHKTDPTDYIVTPSCPG